MQNETLGEWLSAAPFSLAMSSGFFSFFAHTGMLRALESEGLTPKSLFGSSAGALVAGGWAAGLSADELGCELQSLKRSDFWDPKPGLGLLGGRLFRAKLEELLPVETFSECRAPVSISAYDLGRRKTLVLKDGELASAIMASCAFPVLFHPVRRDGSLLSDGGIADRPGLDGMQGSERTFYHHIASRSPWRRAGSKALQIPSRESMVSLRITELPRANPFHLERGVLAMQAAFDATKRALGCPIEGSVVSVAG
ncbi:MAG: patatin [Myxococcales bacterium]|nr:patatin [Myxococcales bacterium]